MNPFFGLLHFHGQGISRFPQIGVLFLTFKKFVPLNRKHKIFSAPSLSFDQWAKKSHASQIECRSAPFSNHWACLTMAECPCLGFMLVKCLGSSAHYFFRCCHSRTHRRRWITSQSAWSACNGKRGTAYNFGRDAIRGLSAWNPLSLPLDYDCLEQQQQIMSISTNKFLFQNLIITLQKSPSICFWRHSWFVPDSSKMDLAHFSYQQGFVMQFPRSMIWTPDLPK